MRATLLAMLATAGCVDDCPRVIVPETAAYSDTMVAAGETLTASWTRQGRDLPALSSHCDAEIHIATGSVGHPFGPEVTLHAAQAQRPVAGARSSVWLAHPDCAQPHPGTWLSLLANGVATAVRLGPADLGQQHLAAVFDGVAYHAFWSVDGVLHHRTVGEDGVLGADQVLPIDAPSSVDHVIRILAAHDGAGTWFVALQGAAGDTLAACWGLRVDLLAQTTTKVWSVTDAERNIRELIWFDGAFRVFGDDARQRPLLTSITPAGVIEEHERDTFGGVVAGPGAIFGMLPTSVGMLDASLTTAVSTGIRYERPGFAVVGDQIVVFEYSKELGELGAVAHTLQGEATARSTLEANGPLVSREDCPMPYTGD